MSKKPGKPRKAAELKKLGLRGRRRDKPGQMALPGIAEFLEEENAKKNVYGVGDKR